MFGFFFVHFKLIYLLTSPLCLVSFIYVCEILYMYVIRQQKYCQNLVPFVLIQCKIKATNYYIINF